MSIIGSNVRRLRTDQGLSMEELSRRTELSLNTIYKIENEKQENPRLETIQRIADGLGVSVTDLLSDVGTEATSNNASA